MAASPFRLLPKYRCRSCLSAQLAFASPATSANRHASFSIPSASGLYVSFTAPLPTVGVVSSATRHIAGASRLINGILQQRFALLMQHESGLKLLQRTLLYR